MKIEVQEIAKNRFDIRKEGVLIGPFNYTGYEDTVEFTDLNLAIDFAKKLADNKLTLAYPKTVYIITEVTNETK